MTPLRRLRRRVRPRRGFTLIEMIIAIIVMAIGVMGLASTASYVATQMGGANVQTIASAVATQVADSLASRKCSAITGGTKTKRGTTITWAVADSIKTKWVTQQVQYTTKRGTRAFNYVTVIQCPEL